MLLSLRIKNLALVEDMHLEWQPGYNAVTGETGAGKSILIGALTLVLGERADRTMIRSGADGCTVEAVFDVSQLRAPLGQFLEENGIEPCEDGQLLLKRSFSNAGSNRQFINGTPTTLNVLATLGEWLVDIHGPHEHQSLLHPARQLAILDAYGKLDGLREQFGEFVRRRAELEELKAGLVVDERTYAQQLDLLRFQVNEIASARLQADEEELLEAEYRRASNAARLIELGQAALNALSENDDSLMTQAGQIGRLLKELEQLDPGAGSLASLHEQAVAVIKEVQSDLSHYVDRIEVDPARLQELENRLNLVQTLKRKYGGTVSDVIAFGEEAARKLAQLEGRDGELNRINAEIGKADAELNRVGAELSTKRKKLIPKLRKAAEAQLADLGFEQSRFDVAVTTASLEECLAAGLRISPTGFDGMEFQFSPNVGEPAKPLRAIASSGEMARVMLALKTVLAAEDDVPLLIFDEVDANVGGVTANAVGEKMRQIARNRQVLCITHLAPVAACADAHYVVSKQVKDGRTLSEINRLEGQTRVAELTRMLGGQGDAARKHAEALLKAVCLILLGAVCFSGCATAKRSPRETNAAGTVGDMTFAESSELLQADSVVVAYERELVSRIQEKWHSLLNARETPLEANSKVVLEFVLHPNGQVGEISIVQGVLESHEVRLAMKAIESASPFRPWPDEVRKKYPAGQTTIKFTFYYN